MPVEAQPRGLPGWPLADPASACSQPEQARSQFSTVLSATLHIDPRIEKLRDETVELERREALLVERQDQEAQTEVFARQAMSVIRDFDRPAAQATVEEKRTLIRAFLRVLDSDPTTRKGVAHFWAVLIVGQDEFLASVPRRGRRNPPPTTASSA